MLFGFRLSHRNATEVKLTGRIPLTGGGEGARYRGSEGSSAFFGTVNHYCALCIRDTCTHQFLWKLNSPSCVLCVRSHYARLSLYEMEICYIASLNLNVCICGSVKSACWMETEATFVCTTSVLASEPRAYASAFVSEYDAQWADSEINSLWCGNLYKWVMWCQHLQSLATWSCQLCSWRNTLVSLWLVE